MSSNPDLNPRLVAAQVLHRVLQEDAYAARLIDNALSKPGWDARDQALLTEIVYGVLRRLLFIDQGIGRFASRGLDSIDPLVLQHLRIAVYQLVFLDRIPHHAILHEAVEAIHALRGPKVAGFSNALLRKIQTHLRDLHPPDPLLDLPGYLSISQSHPRWLIERYLQAFGADRTEARLQAQNQPPPLTLRVHRPWGDREKLLQLLQESELEAEATTFSPDGVRLLTPSGPAIQRLIKEHAGAFIIQDEAAQCIARWLEPQEGERILDACAAPGGKTTNLASIAPQAHITAVDRHANKLRLIQDACKRLNITNVQTQQADLTRPFPQGDFDRILCDAPCSGLGTLRKNPEIRYRRTLEDVQQLAQTQRKILHQLAQALKPGGLLLYAVCTDTTEECEETVEHFLQQHPAFSLEMDFPAFSSWSPLFATPGHLRTSPEQQGMDAFFAVRLRKSS
ncbi:MAG: 16S rRNA (cytosine(967)-C(5))-methyltransferase RsmB [Myxococcales bacterium]|nr:16S rRNA (cytosine(967)-C(5))-methyltransferase RsmB [Myxococcales bacterium]MCB9644901.1 16S rRNA (cytosine(967)-C(5))-methyltransferase RsmB [Myxococcales bacterium]